MQLLFITSLPGRTLGRRRKDARNLLFPCMFQHLSLVQIPDWTLRDPSRVHLTCRDSIGREPTCDLLVAYRGPQTQALGHQSRGEPGGRGQNWLDWALEVWVSTLLPSGYPRVTFRVPLKLEKRVSPDLRWRRVSRPTTSRNIPTKRHFSEIPHEALNEGSIRALR